MAAKIRQLLRMYALYARMDWQFLTRDKRMGLTCMFDDVMTILSSSMGVALLAVRFGGVGGLTSDEILWMLGFYTFADGLTYMLLGYNNVLHISRRIGRSQVDHMLIQPIPLWMQLLTEGFAPFSGCSGFLFGTGLLIFATLRLKLAVTPLWLAMLILYALARMAVALGSSYIFGSAAFYRPAACEELSSVVIDALNTAGRYPYAGLPLWLQGIFTTAIPVTLMAYLPTLILLRRTSAPAALVWPFAAGAGLLALARLCFRRGLRHYATHGCPRYRELGFR